MEEGCGNIRRMHVHEYAQEETMTHQKPDHDKTEQPDGLELNKETLSDLDLERGDAENVKGGVAGWSGAVAVNSTIRIDSGMSYVKVSG